MSSVRRLFGGLAGLLLFTSLTNAQQLNLIQKENRQPGTTVWQLTNPADDRQIEGYASLTSVPVGGNINLFVNTSDSTYSLTVFRMGWYGGKGGRKVLGPQVLPGVQQVTPTPNATGVIECNWTNPFTIHVPSAWLSGIYLAKLHGNTSGKESYIIFAVRDSRTADIVFQQSVSTYQAYNPWPGYDPAGGGYIGQSLYGNDTAGRVSFNRPYGRGIQTNSLYGVGAGDFLTHDFSAAGLGFAFPMDSASFEGQGGPTAWEFGMLRWLEHQGYDVTYITDIDTHEDVNRLLRGKAFLSVGHDEYWSEQMRSNVLQARDSGVNLGFFSGNYMYIAVEFLPDSNGSADRTLALAHETNRCQDTTTGTLTQTQCISSSDCATGQVCAFKQFDYAANNETEQLITGGMWDPPSHDANADIVVTADAPLTHWVFANTGLNVGDVIPGLIGYEYDVLNSEFPSPAGLQTLLHTQAPDFTAAVVVGPPLGDDGGIPFSDTFDEDFDAWYDTNLPFTNRIYTCLQDLIPPLFLPPPDGLCSNPYPERVENHPSGVCCNKTDWTMTIYQVTSGAWVFNAATVQWSWGLDDYFTGLQTPDGANNGPALRSQCGYPFFHPGLVSCRHPAVDQITRNVLNKFIGK